MRNNLRRDDELPLALAACTTGGAAALGLADYGLAPGCHADLVLVPAETLGEAVAQHPAPRTVIRRGRVVAG
jgi:cytosine/adenosine deaminase-related metal-dependent hydrolase